MTKKIAGNDKYLSHQGAGAFQSTTQCEGYADVHRNHCLTPRLFQQPNRCAP
jgi:hypothetical protein